MAALVGAVPALVEAQPPAPSPVLRESTMTLAQVVAEQKRTLSQLTPCAGEVVWREETVSAGGAPAPVTSRAVYFARTATGSVTLIQPWDERPPFPARGGQTNWNRVMAAALVTTDSVFTVGRDSQSGALLITGVPYNPAVHASNPLIAFHPGFIGDEPFGISDLWDAADRLSVRPVVREKSVQGTWLLSIEFKGASAPGDSVTYLVNPSKGYLTDEIRVVRGQRLRVLRQIVNGRTPEGRWMPARAERVEFDESGRPLRRETFYYYTFTTGNGIPRRATTFDALGVRAGTEFEGIAPPPDVLPAALANPSPPRQ